MSYWQYCCSAQGPTRGVYGRAENGRRDLAGPSTPSGSGCAAADCARSPKTASSVAKADPATEQADERKHYSNSRPPTEPMRLRCSQPRMHLDYI